MADARVEWTGGAGGWQRFVQALLFAGNFSADGPIVNANRTGGRYPVGTLQINGGAVVRTIKPGHLLVIADRRPKCGASG